AGPATTPRRARCRYARPVPARVRRTDRSNTPVHRSTSGPAQTPAPPAATRKPVAAPAAVAPVAAAAAAVLVLVLVRDQLRRHVGPRARVLSPAPARARSRPPTPRPAPVARCEGSTGRGCPDRRRNPAAARSLRPGHAPVRDGRRPRRPAPEVP